MTSFGDIVYIDLSTGSITREPCPEDLVRKYLGARGLSDYLLYKHMDPEKDPLAPENPIIFSNGLLTGSRMITSGRFHITARSPLTGLLGTSNGGGHFAPELRACGIMSIMVTGKAGHPVYIKIHGDDISIEDAGDIWGLTTSQSEIKMIEAVGDKKAKTVLIGPGSENLTNIGAVMTGSAHFAGRTGMGTVMGSKNLKGLVALKKEKLQRNDSQKMKDLVKEIIDYTKAHSGWEAMQAYGSSQDVTDTDEQGALATRNFNDVKFEGVDTACGKAFVNLETRYRSCFNCPIHCKAEVTIDSGRHKGLVADRGEYEILAAFGPKCGNADGLESIYFSHLCNELGIDSIEAPGLIAFAMDLYEKGIIKVEDTGGLELTWGNIEAIEALINQIAFKSTWLGEALSMGIIHAAKTIGRGAEKFAYHVKGMGITIMDPRGYKGTGLGYAIGSRGADFTYIYCSPELRYGKERAAREFGSENAFDRLKEDGKGRMVAKTIKTNAVTDALGICKIFELGLLMDFDCAHISSIVAEASGIDFTPGELVKVGERIVNIERLINFRCGATGEDDRLPEKFLTEPVKKGPCKGSVVDIETMKQEYYDTMGWTDSGEVTDWKKTELGLDDIPILYGNN